MGVLLRAVMGLLILVLVSGVTPTSASAAIRPDPATADADKPAGYRNGCHLGKGPTTPKGCVYGDTTARRTMTLVGDSKARQWLPTLDRYGKARKWRIVAHTKSACSFSQADLPLPGSSRRYRACMTWNDKVRAQLRRDPPRVVVVALYNKYARSSKAARTGPERRAAMLKGLRSSWRSAIRSGSQVVVLNSSPYIGTPYPGHPSWEAPDCVAAHRADPQACAVPALPALTARSVWSQGERDRAVRGLGRIDVVDLNPTLCGPETCPVVIGDVLVYRDTHHLTATAARWLYPYLRNRLDPLL
ncbi:MAG: SGNH hydrolase domain-containing protein [Aeromicrobium sp.]